VPLDLPWSRSTPPSPQTLESLAAEGKRLFISVHFRIGSGPKASQDFTSSTSCHAAEEKADLRNALEACQGFTSPYGPEIKKWLSKKHGI